MFEFLLFLRSLFQVISDYIYNHHISKLRKYYEKLSLNITKNQRAFIIWPVSIAFILSYPAIYSLYTSPDSLENSYITDLQNIGIGIQSTSFQDPESIDSNALLLKQLWVAPSNLKAFQNGYDIESGALDKGFLVDALKLQTELLDGINQSEDSFAFVHTPFQYWDNDLERLKSDKFPLRVLQKNSAKTNSSGVSLSHNGLFSGIVKINGLIKSAQAIRILIFYKSGKQNNLDAGKIWDSNLQLIKESNTNSKFSISEVGQDDHNVKTFLLKLTKMNSIDHFILTTSYVLIALYFVISLSNLRSVRSRIGLLCAFIVELILSVLSSATLTTYFFQGVDFYQIPLQFLPFVVVVVGIENMFRLVTLLSETPGELSISSRMSKALSGSGITSTLIVFCDLVILSLIYPIVVPNTKQFCIFASFALIIDHILHLTYFAAVLSIDVHRLELHDLLNNDSHFKVTEKKRWYYSLFDTKRRTSLVDSLSENEDQITVSSVANSLKNFILKIKLPFSTTVTGTLVMIMFLIGTNIRWTDDSLKLPLVGKPKQDFGLSTSPQEFSTHIQTYTETQYDLVCFLDKKSFSTEIFKLLENVNQQDFSNVFIAVYNPVVALYGEGDKVKTMSEISFNLNTTYKFDLYYILEFLTSLAFILSIALVILRSLAPDSINDTGDELKKQVIEEDHTFQSKVLSGGHFLDIIKITTSRSPFIVSVGLDHKVLVWSPVSQPMPIPSQLPISSNIWPITHVVLSDHGNYISVFSKTGAIQCYSRLTMTWVWKIEIEELKNNQPLEAFFRHKTIPAFLQRKMAADLLQQARSTPSSRRNSMRSIASPKLGPAMAFANNTGVNKDLEELVIVLKSGQVAVVSCEDGSIKKEKLSAAPLVSSGKLVTPRVNDRLVSCTEDGKLLLSTAVNNKWKTRIVRVDEEKFNNPNITLSGSHTLPYIKEEETPEQSAKLNLEFRKSSIAIVPFVGFIVRTHGCCAEIIDVQTGILIKRFKIRQFKKNTLRVFHDQPTHCRFCGSVSISSFTVVYTTENNSVVMHTFNVDHRAKTSICLRVERDPREIRCVGFNSVTEHQHELGNAEGWTTTDKNQIVGIRRKTEEEVKESLSETRTSTLRKRRAQHHQHHSDENAPRLHDLWEGWAMGADGKVDYYDIPDVGNAGGLLVNSIGQINRFGHKSIVVAFGNIMQVLYLGNDDLIYNDEDKGATNEISGLSFVNKRRKNLKRTDMTSTNFSEVDAIPGISELSL